MDSEKMDDKEGIYLKYVVYHARDVVAKSTTIENGQKTVEDFLITDDLGINPIEGFFFVLRPEVDYHARVALMAYAGSVEADNPQLAADVMGALELLNLPERRAPD